MIDSVITNGDLGTFDELINNSRYLITSTQQTEGGENLKTKYDILTIIDDGYDILPKPYHEAFLDPLKNLILNNNYQEVSERYGGTGNLLEDWVACINQRSKVNLSSPTHAFTELCADIYDGYVSNSVRKDAILPGSQILAPLTKWGGKEPYTKTVRAGQGIGMKTSVISLPTKYSKNIALWPLCVHECYHDVVDAYKGLLNEAEDKVLEKFESAEVKEAFNDPIIWNGRKDIPLSEFAAEYWRRTMSETLADVCGLLNIGPACGISFALLAMTLGSKDIVPKSYIDDPHPNDVLRIRIAIDVIDHLNGLAMNVREGYIGFLNQVIEKYVNEKNNLILYCQDLNRKKNEDVIVPYENMMKTVNIVVKTIAFTRLKALGNHSLSEINAWTNRDEVLTQRIYHDLQKNEKPGTNDGPDDQEVYAAHIVAAATIALVKRPQLELITNLAIESLCERYNSNPIWRGLGAFRSDVDKRDEWKGRNKSNETEVK